MSIIERIAEDGSDISEYILDTFIKNDFIREFPIIGSAVKIALGVKSVADLLFLRKIEKFIYKLRDINSIELNSMLNKLNGDSAHTNKVGEVIILLLNRYNDLEKPYYLAVCFRAYITNVISFDDFIRLGNAIDLSHSPDLATFINDSENESVQDSLVRTGLTEISKNAISATQSGMSPVNLFVKHSEMGKTFLQIFTLYNY